jgi:hypothetical protein
MFNYETYCKRNKEKGRTGARMMKVVRNDRGCEPVGRPAAPTTPAPTGGTPPPAMDILLIEVSEKILVS